MNVIRASVMGFCFGVRRAVEMAEKALAENPGKKVYSLGPLIHNENALRSLEENGLRILREDEVPAVEDGSVVVIRAHGVAPDVLKILEEKNCVIVDATCPRVRSSQKMVERYTAQNDYVILSGDRNHGEVIGIAGYAGKNFIQIENLAEAEKISLPENANVILMSQTTFSIAEFDRIQNVLKSKIKNIAVMNTICPATSERQAALLELCSHVDGVLVIGGKNSANTKRLYQTAATHCNLAAHIQGAKEIPPEFFSLGTVGITAGASTPDEIIAGAEGALLNHPQKL